MTGSLDTFATAGVSVDDLMKVNKMADAINPNHYQFDNGVQTIDITQYLSFSGGNAVKYITRATRMDGHVKGNVIEDLKKARWYINREIDRIEGMNNE